MKVGFSLSPGGLLLPYHMGVLHCLQEENVIDSSTLVAGSSAGSIATMAHGCNVHPYKALEATIDVSNTCKQKYGHVHGKLLQYLQHHMETLVGDQEFLYLQNNGNIGISYQQIFPYLQSHLQTRFKNRRDLFNAVSYSCMFPFFTTNQPWLIDFTSSQQTKEDDNGNNLSKVPRIMVDGIFSVPWDRFGCPHLENIAGVADNNIDRTVAISVMPRHVLNWCGNGMNAFSQEDCISPSLGGNDKNHDLTIHLARIAAFPSSRKELTQVFELGYRDAEIWCRQEEDRQKQRDNISRREKLQKKYQKFTRQFKKNDQIC